MRNICRILVGMVALAFVTVPVLAQPGEQSRRFRGVKLVDIEAPKPAERDVVVLIEADRVVIRDSRTHADLKTLPYDRIVRAAHSFASAPPLGAGTVAATATQPLAAPTYFGKKQRHWLVFETADDTAVLRVSERVYRSVRAAYEERSGSAISEGRTE